MYTDWEEWVDIYVDKKMVEMENKQYMTLHTGGVYRLNEMALSMPIFSLLFSLRGIDTYNQEIMDPKFNSVFKFVSDHVDEELRRTGCSTLEELITYELTFPRMKNEYESLTEDQKIKFWNLVMFIQKKLNPSNPIKEFLESTL